uniref:Nuclear factor of activated T cells 4 n=1 Tax=Oryzias latipes TaxID=8090 RepID=H2LCP7_ORYLA
MGAAPGSGWEEGEFEFKLVFEEDPPQRRSQGSSPAQSINIPSPPLSSSQRAGMHSPPPRRAPIREFSGTYESLPARSVKVSESRVVECPSIQITTISPEDEPAPTIPRYWDMGNSGVWDRERLYLPLLDPFTYRDRCPGSLSPSPASSPSSRGWLSPASSCDSLLVEDEELNETTISFGLSPSTRPTSPGGKKRRNSPLASPCTSRRGSYSEELQGCNLEGGDLTSHSQGPTTSCELSIPQKTRKKSLEQLSPREVDKEQAPGHSSPGPLPETQQTRREPLSLGMDYLSVPPALAWGRTRASAHSPLFSNALPPLDWPLPSQFDQYELRIEVQPRPHHRAHYETEGSRGAVKASPTGHPVVTGKMVGTASHESIQAGTKLLDIPLSPENNMTAIDCAGILKLRNSDIELRKGETDVGRKNTRVRLVFRTHFPVAAPVAPAGRLLALQVASLPIECQRSAQELPIIESVSLTACSVEGGEELLLSGTNFLPISRVLFMERGKLQWEEEAYIDRDNSNESLLCVRVPAYSDLSVSRPVSVNLYVSNGKRKRSSTHCFKYLPMFNEEDPLLSRPSAPPQEGGTSGSVGAPPRMDRSLTDEGALSFHLHPYPTTYSPPCPTMSYNEEYCSKPDALGEEPGGSRGALSERHPSFENLELGFTDLLPPLYPRGPQPPSPSPWLDSPYLSSSPSPSHSSSLSPFPTGSPISNSPLPPVPSSPYPHYPAYTQEVCPSPPINPNPYQDICQVPYSHFEGWDPHVRVLGMGHGREGDGKIQEYPEEFSSSTSMHHLTFEEFIGEDMQSYQCGSHIN